MDRQVYRQKYILEDDGIYAKAIARMPEKYREEQEQIMKRSNQLWDLLMAYAKNAEEADRIISLIDEYDDVKNREQSLESDAMFLLGAEIMEENKNREFSQVLDGIVVMIWKIMKCNK